jgi:hypothetical protein
MQVLPHVARCPRNAQEPPVGLAPTALRVLPLAAPAWPAAFSPSRAVAGPWHAQQQMAGRLAVVEDALVSTR